MADDWDDLAGWWEAEAASDPAYPADVHPLFHELLPPVRGRTIDLGCGEGQGMRLVRGSVFGVDRSRALARRALPAGPVVVGELPSLAWCRDDTFDLIGRSGLYEYFDALDGSGAGGGDFTWTAAVALAWGTAGRDAAA